MKVKELLSGPEKWIKGAEGKDADGYRVSGEDRSAVCWCLAGAIRRCYCNPVEQINIARRIQVEFIGMGVNLAIDQWNDAPERTFEEVKALVEELDI